MNEICDFRDTQSRPLLGSYSREELEEWLRVQTTKAEGAQLPPLLLLRSAAGLQIFIAKENLLPYTIKLLNDTRPLIRSILIREWRALLYKFESIPPMNDDAAFCRDLNQRLPQVMPALEPALDSGYLPLMYAETQDERGRQPDLGQFFGNNRVAGLDILLGLDRKNLLTDVRILLPVWYTIPVLSWFFRLFASAGQKRQQRKAAKAGLQAGKVEETTKVTANSRALEFAQAAREAEKKMLPAEYSLDQYLQHLVGRWNTLLDANAKANLTEDINSLVRDYLRGILRNLRPSAFNPERIKTLAANLADRPNLLQIRNHAALEEYIRIYMIKLLKR
ncbi:MAG TPA: hypothetical protein DCX65_00750 [Spirochaetaceae bacterium]|nr:hypothetical protein [Spirochaetaceae bacterium]